MFIYGLLLQYMELGHFGMNGVWGLRKSAENNYNKNFDSMEKAAKFDSLEQWAQSTSSCHAAFLEFEFVQLWGVTGSQL